MNSLACSELALIIADRLAADLWGFKGRSLPSVRMLASRYSVSVSTISAALHELSRRKIIEVSPRRRARIPEKVQSGLPEQTATSSAERLFVQLTRAMRDGTIRSGEMLPKTDQLAEEMGISRSTIRRVYQQLIDRGLAWRRGRTVRAGTSAPAQGGVPSLVIALLVWNDGSWKYMTEDPREREFALEFANEAQRRGVRVELIPYLWNPSLRMPVTSPALIRTYIKAWGNSFAGSVVVCNQKRFELMQPVVKILASCKDSPCLVYDHNGIMSSDVANIMNVRRLYFDEDAFLRCLTEGLVRNGHRYICYYTTDEHGWQEARAAKLKAIGALCTPPLHITVVRALRQILWSSAHVPELKSILTRQHREGHLATQRIISDLVPMSDSLCRDFAGTALPEIAGSPYAGIVAAVRQSLEDNTRMPKALFPKTQQLYAAVALQDVLLNPEITAVIAPNDVMCRYELHRWILDLGIRLPHDLSLVSFDNIYRQSFYPLSSVDPGLASLGYAAVHALLDRKAYGKNGLTDIPSAPFISNGGTLGPAPIPGPSRYLSLQTASGADV